MNDHTNFPAVKFEAPHQSKTISNQNQFAPTVLTRRMPFRTIYRKQTFPVNKVIIKLTWSYNN